MEKIFALVDCNSFYASCEKIFNPKLEGFPVVVLSNNDGCVVACSAEAKKLNVKIGTPIFECERLIKKHGGAIFSSNYTLYGDMSRRVMEILSQFCLDIEIYSIDEAFLSFNGMIQHDLTEYGKEIKSTVRQWTGIPVSVGIANTKTLAKLANRAAKKDTSLNGVFSLIDKNNIDSLLASFDVDDIWGVGEQYSKLLKSHGIYNALQLRDADDAWIKKNMTIVGLRTVKELRGTPCISLEEAPPAKKGIVSSKSFSRPVESLDELKEAISVYTSTAAVKLRTQRSVTASITVFLMTDRFRQEPQYSNSCTLKIPVATSYTPDLIRYAVIGIDKIYKCGYRYKKCGVMFDGIFPEEDIQRNLFIPDNSHKIPLMHTIDAINKKYGSNVIKTAAEGINNPWSMRRNRLSPRYTTQWSDIFTVY